MRNLIPHFILERYEAGEWRGSFSAAAIFVDISGFSSITETLMVHGQHGAEVLAGLMGAIFEPLVFSVFGHGGFIVGFAGDAFTAVFPDDDNADQVPAHVLAAAWEMQESAARVGNLSTPYGSFTLSAKIGVAAGEVDWGIIAAENGRRATYYFRGTAIDGCAAAEHLCQSSDVVLDSAVYQAVAELVNADPVDDHFRVSAVNGPLPQAQVIDRPLPNTETLAHFLPKTVIDQPRIGEFRQVVNVFISIPSIRTEAQLRMLMETIFVLQDQYGGYLIRLDYGDKGCNLLLFWGAPIAYENDVERVLNFVLDLQVQTSVPIKMGITYQIVHAGFIGSSLHQEYTCYGRGVNLAARFMTGAPRGEIWVDENIARQAGRRYEIEFENNLPFKGFSEPQPVYSLLERKEEPEALFEQALVGRENELAQLSDFVRPIFEGQYAGMFIIWGEPGIGKSHLLHEFRTAEVFDEMEVLWAVCQTDEILRESFNPFRYWLRRYFDQSLDQSETRNKRNFNRQLVGLISDTADPELSQELDRARSFLGALVDLDWPDSLYEQLDPKARFQNTLLGLIALFQAESLLRPVVILLEDAQWLDEDSVQFLERLALGATAEADKAYPIAILATARPTPERTFFGSDQNNQEIVLGSLPKDKMGALSADLLDGPVSPDLIDWLLDRTEGNPFFTEQLVRYLKENKLLTQVKSGWTLAAQPSDLPSDVRAVLVARIDQLTSFVKEAVLTAAALGREFEVRLLAIMLENKDRLPQILDQAEIAAVWAALGQLRYIFKHALMRDAAYKMQVRARRQILHQLAAEALMSLYADDLSPHYGELAYHSEQAGLVEQARHYLELAGDQAQADYQNSQAIDYYSRALALTPEDDLNGRYRLLLAREGLYDLKGNRENQSQDLAILFALADQLDDSSLRAEVRLRRSQLAINTGDYAGAITAAEEAIGQAQTADDALHIAAGHTLWASGLRQQGNYDAAFVRYEIARDQAQAAGEDKILAQCLQGMGGVAFYQGDLDKAIHHFEQALAHYRQLGDERGESVCLHSLGVVAKNLGDYTTARQFAEDALAAYRLIGHQQGEGFCLTNLGSIARRESDFTKAAYFYREALENSRRIGDRSAESVCLGNLGVVACDVGNYAEAEPYLQEALNTNRALGDKMGESHCLNNLGVAVHDKGDLLQAQSYLNEGLAISREIGFREAEGTILNELAIVTFDLGNFDEAQKLFEAAYGLRRDLAHKHYMAEDLVGLAQTALASGNLELAKQYVEEVLALLEDNPTMAGAERPFRVHLICYQVLRAAGDERGVALLRHAYKLVQEQAANIEDETLRLSFLQAVPSHGEIGREFKSLP